MLCKHEDLGFWQEKGATDAVNKLLEIVQSKTTLLRDDKVYEHFVAVTAGLNSC
ncbi:MAG: hypothetical protein WA364_07060 [Candidatus Nitrosopolaris sp.]